MHRRRPEAVELIPRHGQGAHGEAQRTRGCSGSAPSGRADRPGGWRSTRWRRPGQGASGRPHPRRAGEPAPPPPLFEYGLDKGDAHRPGGHRESFPSSRRVMRASSSPPTVEASNSRVPRRAGLRQTRVPFCRSWQPQLSGDGPPCSVRNAYPSRQPPAASRQPPAASRQPPPATRQPCNRKILWHCAESY